MKKDGNHCARHPLERFFICENFLFEELHLEDDTTSASFSNGTLKIRVPQNH